jgi:hypothetical protein
VKVVATTITKGVRSEPPAPGAWVAIDKPGGGHDEVQTDKDGRVTFDDLDWSQGKASLAAYLDQSHYVYGVADVDPTNAKTIESPFHDPEADVVLYLVQRKAAEYPDAVTLDLQGLPGASVETIVSATTAPTYLAPQSTPATLPVRAGEPFTLLAYELDPGTPPSTRELAGSIIRWARYDEPAPAGPITSLSVDLASGGTPITPTITHATIDIPGGDQGPFGAFSLPIAGATGGLGYEDIGIWTIPTTATLSPDHMHFDMTIAVADATGFLVRTQYGVRTAAQMVSYNTRVGLPADGDVTGELLPPPQVNASSVHLKEPLVIEGAAPSATTRVGLCVSTECPWIVDVPPGVTEIHLPTPPAAAAAIATAMNLCLVQSLESLDATGIFTKVAVTPYLPLAP